MVADEVVTGFGRTGKMWGSESVDFSSDHATMGKGITSGYFPLSAIAIGESLQERMKENQDALTHLLMRLHTLPIQLEQLRHLKHWKL